MPRRRYEIASTRRADRRCTRPSDKSRAMPTASSRCAPVARARLERRRSGSAERPLSKSSAARSVRARAQSTLRASLRPTRRDATRAMRPARRGSTTLSMRQIRARRQSDLEPAARRRTGQAPRRLPAARAHRRDGSWPRPRSWPPGWRRWTHAWWATWRCTHGDDHRRPGRRHTERPRGPGRGGPGAREPDGAAPAWADLCSPPRCSDAHQRPAARPRGGRAFRRGIGLYESCGWDRVGEVTFDSATSPACSATSTSGRPRPGLTAASPGGEHVAQPAEPAQPRRSGPGGRRRPRCRPPASIWRSPALLP